MEDLKTGPKEPRSVVRTEEVEAAVVAFRHHSLLLLDDCFYAPQPLVPHLTRPTLHRLQRHGIARLPVSKATRQSASKVKRYPIHRPAGDLQANTCPPTEPDNQERDGEAVPLRQSRPAAHTLRRFLRSNNFAHRLKMLHGLTPMNTSVKSGHQSRTDSS